MRAPGHTGPVRRLSVVLTTSLLATLLALPLAALAPTAGDAAGPHRAGAKKRTTIALRLAPDRVTVYPNGTLEPTGLVAQVTPAAAGRVVTFQQRVGSRWRALGKARTDATGRAYRPLTVRTVGVTTYRSAVAGTRTLKPAVSTARSLTANANTSCRPSRAAAVPGTNGEAVCLLARLDTWARNGLMAVGQQVNVASKDSWAAPLSGIRPAVVGFDLEELSVGDKPAEEGAYVDANTQGLLDRAKSGAVLVASWHATNPVTGEPYASSRIDLTRLTTPGNAAYDAFWADWSEKLELLRRFQDGDSDGNGDNGPVDGERTAVVVRPLHEVNGDFFWWGKPAAATYRAIWSQMQARAAEAGVHNIVWAYSGNRRTVSTTDPAAYVPTRVDVGGLDSYDPEVGRGNAVDAVGLEGYAGIAQRVPRIALTEVGPHGSTDGSWNPRVISTAVRAAKIAPLWAMLWFDDGVPRGADTASGRKQITSLAGGRAWLRSCLNSLCSLR